MINTELRLGNWVEPQPNIQNQQKGKVTQIYMNGFTVDYHYPGTWFIGIKITEDILKKCGFIYKHGFYTIGKDLISFIFNEGKLQQTFVFIDMQFRQIIYLHELQNLYYSLAGNELEIAW